MSATPDSTLVNPEHLADLQRQLAECRAELDKAQRYLNETTTERDEALAREAATADVLQVINSSPGDLTPVFDAILEKAHTLCNASSGGLVLIEDNGYRPIAIHGEAAFRDDWLSQGWLPFSTLALSVLGLLDAGYQTYTHFSNTGLVGCSAKGDSCVVVQTSSYAWVFGIPVAVLGLAFFVFMVVINSPQAWRAKNPWIPRLRLAAVVVGMLFVLYLIYNELIRIGQVCEYCTSVHIITFILFALIVYQATAPAKPAPAGDKDPAQPPAKTAKSSTRR